MQSTPGPTIPTASCAHMSTPPTYSTLPSSSRGTTPPSSISLPPPHSSSSSTSSFASHKLSADGFSDHGALPTPSTFLRAVMGSVTGPGSIPSPALFTPSVLALEQGEPDPFAASFLGSTSSSSSPPRPPRSASPPRHQHLPAASSMLSVPVVPDAMGAVKSSPLKDSITIPADDSNAASAASSGASTPVVAPPASAKSGAKKSGAKSSSSKSASTAPPSRKRKAPDSTPETAAAAASNTPDGGSEHSGSHHSDDDEEDHDEDDEAGETLGKDGKPKDKRQRHLERNRAAASKSRQRRKQWLANLELRYAESSTRNADLLAEATTFRDQIIALRAQLVAHKACSPHTCSVVATYLSDPTPPPDLTIVPSPVADPSTVVQGGPMAIVPIASPSVPVTPVAQGAAAVAAQAILAAQAVAEAREMQQQEGSEGDA